MKSLSFTHCWLVSWSAIFSEFITARPLASEAAILANSTFKPVSHVIFDIDDVILKAYHIYTMADEMILKKFEKEYPFSLVRKTIGLSPSEAAAVIIKYMDLHISVDDYVKMASEFHKDLLQRTEIMPGVLKLCNHFRKHNIPIGLTTSGSVKNVAAEFKNHPDLFRLFDHITVAEDDFNIIESKPNPDLFLVAMRKFTKRPRPENCLVFEDSPNGLIAAHRANMQVVAVPVQYISPEHLKFATLVIKSLEDFKPELFGLPPFDAEVGARKVQQGRV